MTILYKNYFFKKQSQTKQDEKNSCYKRKYVVLILAIKIWFCWFRLMAYTLNRDGIVYFLTQVYIYY